MFRGEEVSKVKRGFWIFLAFTLALEIALILLSCYKNIFIAFLIFVAPPLLISIVKWPKSGLWLMTIISFTVLGEHLLPRALMIATVVTAATFFAKIFIKEEKLLPSKQLVYFIIFGAVALLSFFPSRDLVMWGKGIYEILSIFIFFILIVNLVKTNRDLWILIYIIVFSITIGAIYGLYSFKSSSFLNVLVSTGALVRSTGVVYDANLWSVSLITAFPLSIALVKREKNIIVKLLLWAVIVILISSIFATFSRGGIIAFTIVTVIIIFKILKKKWFGIFILLLSFVLIYFILPPFIILRIESLLQLFQKKSIMDVSLLSRIYVMKGTLRMFLEHPLLGVGLSNVISNSGFYFPFGLHLVAHCMYLEIAAGTGLLGLVPFLAIFFYSFKDFIHSYKVFNKKGERSLADLSFFAGLSLLGVCITALFLSIQFNRSIWFLIAISVILKNLLSNYELKTDENSIYD